MMKKAVYIVLVLLLSGAAHAQNLKVGSFNIRYENARDYAAGNGWDDRYPWICSFLRYERPDIFGSQEVLHDQLLDMAGALPGYAYVGVGRDDGKEKGEYEPVFWRTERFKLLDSGNFWISETPERPGLGWDAACIRVCTWVYLKDRITKRRIRFFNLHLDHVGVVARREGAKLIVSKIRELSRKGDVVFVTGDFNVDQTNEIYQTFVTSGILEDSFEAAADRYAPVGTINTFDPNALSNSRIDHVFVTAGTRVDNYAVLTETYRAPIDLKAPGAETVKGVDFPREVSFQKYIAKMLSDHFPVFVNVTL